MQGRIVSFLLVLLAPFFAHDALAAAGRTEASVSVTPQGAARYSIPLVVPSGAAGMTPQLSVTYDSRVGASALGVGWTIGGLSAITRCPRTMAQDGTPRSVRLDIQDRYCLDGNRLRLTAGNYGEANSQYQTETEWFTRVTGYSSVGTSPLYFIAEHRDGLIYEYGNTADSRIEAVGLAAPRVWALNKIRDRSGNAITFTYNEDTVNGGYLINSVSYTSNDDQGIAAPYFVNFIYQSVPVGEVNAKYYAGAIVKRLTRLQRVEIKRDTTLIRHYAMFYQADLSTTLRSRLAYIEECAGAQLDCYATTQFSYQDGIAGFEAALSTQQTIADPAAGLLILDVNGDGRSDLVYSSTAASGTGTWLYALANSSGGYGTAVNSGITNTDYQRAVVLDYNADGSDDFLIPYSGGTWWVVLGTSAGLSSPTNTNIAAEGEAGQVRAMDVTGDGLDDLVWSYVDGVGGDTIYYRARQLSGTFSAPGYLVSPVGLDFHIVTPVFGDREREFSNPSRKVDFNGDGFEDFIVKILFSNLEVGPNQLTTLLQLGGGAGQYTIDNAPTNAQVYHLDLNDDGYTDIAYPSGSNWRYIFSRGTSMAPYVVGPTTNNQLVGSATVLDYEGDGYEDLIVRNTSDNLAYQLRSTGEGLQAPNNGASSDAGTLHFTGDANGDGLFDQFLIQGGVLYYRLRTGPTPDLLTQVTDGLDNIVSFTYKRLNASDTCYSRDLAAPAFPSRAYFGPMPVVCTVTANNGIGGTYTLSYSYANADVHLQGRRYLGFGKRQVVDSRNNLASIEEYSTDYSHYERIGASLKETLRLSSSSTPIHELTRTWSFHAYGTGTAERRLPYPSQTVAKEYESGGAYSGRLLRTVTTTNSMDYTSGTLYDTTSTTVEGTNANGIQPGAVHVERTFLPVADLVVNTSSWCIGRPQRIETSRSHDQYGGNQLTRIVALSWDQQKCRPTQQITQPDDSLLQVTRSLGYDDFGNLETDAVTGIGMTPRSTTYYWGTDGRFLRTITNPLNQATSLTWNDVLGLLETLTDPNDSTTEWHYDEFSRPRSEERPDGTSTLISYQPCSIAAPCTNVQFAKILVAQTERNTALATIAEQRSYLDGLERVVASSGPSLNGGATRIERQYDALGRVVRVGAPCWWSGCAGLGTDYHYDALNRLDQVSWPVPDSNTTLVDTKIYYEGLTTRVVDGQSKQTTKVANATGAVARSEDHAGYYQTFDYDAFGNAVRVTDSLGYTLITNTFNVLGIRTAQTERAAGSRTYTPNALGEIVSELDSKGQTASFEYDLLGRLRKRIEPEGVSEWTWGASATDKNIGQLQSVSGPGYSESYLYDGVGRLQQTTISADAASYVYSYGYNDIGTLSTLTYPVTTAGSPLKLLYEYQNGLLARVKDFNTPSTVYWAVNSTDAAGHVIDETLGNGIQTIRGFDAITGLIDYVQSTTSAGASVQNLNYEWNEVGSLHVRQDGNLGLTETIEYDDLHRLHTVTGPDPIVVNYDARGNITSRTGNPGLGASSTIQWTSYDLPSSITGPSGYSSTFSYTPDRNHWKQVAGYGSTSETTIYVNGLLEKVTRGASVDWKHYIMVPTGAVAMQVRTGSSIANLYLTYDHLGSVDSVTDAAGAIAARMSYGPFGHRRDTTTWSGSLDTTQLGDIADTTRRGFTSHDMLDNLSLIHMNGRVYDRLSGGFLSPDPFVSDPELTQSFNRYAYVRNNPLSLIDPSGYNETTYWDTPGYTGEGWFDGLLGDWFNDVLYDYYLTRHPDGGPRKLVANETDTRTDTNNDSAVGGVAALSATAIAVRGRASASAARALGDPRVLAIAGSALLLTGEALVVVSNLPSSRFLAKSEQHRPVPVFAVDNVVTREVVRAAERGDAFITSYKAPSPSNIDAILSGGFFPGKFPGGAYLSFNPAAVLPYANAYGLGAFVVNTRLSTFTQLVAAGQVVPDALVPGGFIVLTPGLPAFTSNSTITYLPPTGNAFYELFLKR